MSSFSHSLRKNQKAIMAVVGVIIMLGFVLVGPWSGMATTQQAEDMNTRVASWSQGEFTEGDISRMRAWRLVVNRFVGIAQTEAGVPPQDITQYASDERSLVQERILAARAAKLGIEVSNEAVDAYIRYQTGDRVSAAKLSQIVRTLRVQLGNELRVTEAQLYDAFKPMLAAFYYQLAAASTMTGETPAERWDFYSRLNRRLSVQVMPIRVEDFVGQVAEPTERELSAFYEQYKDRVPASEFVQGRMLASPTPGFKQPFRAEFQFVEAVHDQFVERILTEDKFTAEEIQKYYDQNKEFRFIERELPSLDDEPAGDGTSEDSPAGEGTDDSMPADDGAESGNPAGEGTVKSASSGEDTNEATDEEAPATDAGSADAATDSSLGFSVPVSAEFLGDDQLADDVDVEVKVKEDTAPAGDATALPAGEDTSLPAGEAAQEPAGEDTAPAGESTDDPASTSPPAPEKNYQSLEKATPQIKEELARQRAGTQMRTALESMNEYVRDFSQAYSDWELDQANNPGAPKPQLQGLEKKAAELGLTAPKTTPLMSVDQARNYKEFPFQTINLFGQESSLAEVVFREDLPRFQPVQQTDAENNLYSIWKTEQQVSYVPPLNEVRDNVIFVWKMQKARELALAEAERLAATARQERGDLKKVFEDRTVIDVLPFTWMTVPMFQQSQTMPRLTRMDQLDNVGPAFMQTSMQLDNGDVGIAANHPQTVVYVIRKTEANPPVSNEYAAFGSRVQVDYNSIYPVAAIAANEEQRRWREQIFAESGLTWTPGHPVVNDDDR